MINSKILKIIIISFYYISFYNYQAVANICLTESTDTELSFQKESYTGQDINVWIVSNNGSAYTCYDHKKSFKRLMMGYRYKIIQNNYRVKHNGKNWSLLVEDSIKIDRKKLIGWVPHDDIIIKNKPIKNMETNLYQKVLIKEGDCINGNGLKIFNDRELINSNEAINIGSVFYVYDFYPRNVFFTDIKSLLISPLSSLGQQSKSEPLLIGWIDRKSIIFWNTRIACDFPVGSIVKMIDDNKNMLFKTKRISTPLLYNAMRNPILSLNEDYYKIAAFSRLSIQQLNLKSKKSLFNIKTGLEVLFVMDGSESMTHAFNATRVCIKETANSLKKKAEEIGVEKTRFGLMVYRNINKNSNLNYCKDETTLYPMGSVQKFINNLQNHVVCKNDSNVIEVPMYVGLIEGVKYCQFDTGYKGGPKRLRTIIHLGDARDNGNRNYTPKNISDIFKQHHIYKYISINVSGNKLSGFDYSVKNIPFKNKKHFIQLPKPPKIIEYIIGEFIQDIQGVSEQIKIISKGTMLSNGFAGTIMSKGFAGTSHGIIGEVSDEILKYAKNLIQANNIKLTDSGFKQYVEGFVSKETPLKKYLLVSITEIEKITFFLTNLIESKNTKFWDNCLQIILGDETCEKNGIELSLEECNNSPSTPKI